MDDHPRAQAVLAVRCSSGVTHQAAMNALGRLEHLGLITAETTHGRVTFKADDVGQLLEQ